MRTATWSLAILTLAAIAPDTGSAQDNDSRSMGRPVWNIAVHGGLTEHGKFLLQRPTGATSPDRERSLRTESGYDVGGAIGVDFMPRAGLRTSYTFAESDFRFRDDTGNGAETLNIDDVGRLRSHFAAVELITYMLGAQAPVTPYASAGIVGAWWDLDEDTPQIRAGAERTEFRLGGVATVGLHAGLGMGLGVRLEAVRAHVVNPFTGRESFQALGGTTIDEPGRVNKTDYRFALVYNIGGARKQQASASQ